MELKSRRKVDIDTRAHGRRIGALLDQLTAKQMDAIIRAYDNGYYGFPRAVSTESVATSMGISRPTYEEHLRKAENKVMDMIVPYLKLFRTDRPLDSGSVS